MASLPACAQVVVTQVNDEGVPAPCIGIGVGVLLVKKCTEAISKQGFVKRDQWGDPGFTVGRAEQDGILTKVEPNSAASAAGLQEGDALVSVDGKLVKPSPGEAAAEQIFGERDQTVSLRVRHGGADRAVSLKRAAASAPDQPKALGFLYGIRVLIDWRGKYIPCNSVAGPAGLPTLAYCEHTFKPYGYIRASELGTIGLVFAPDASDRALVSAVAPGSPAAAADIAAGDEVLEVDGKPLTGFTWQKANLALFAKPGEKRQVTVRRGDKLKTADLVLPAGK